MYQKHIEVIVKQCDNNPPLNAFNSVFGGQKFMFVTIKQGDVPFYHLTKLFITVSIYTNTGTVKHSEFDSIDLGLFAVNWREILDRMA